MYLWMFYLALEGRVFFSVFFSYFGVPLEVGSMVNDAVSLMLLLGARLRVWYTHRNTFIFLFRGVGRDRVRPSARRCPRLVYFKTQL